MFIRQHIPNSDKFMSWSAKITMFHTKWCVRRWANWQQGVSTPDSCSLGIFKIGLLMQFFHAHSQGKCDLNGQIICFTVLQFKSNWCFFKPFGVILVRCFSTKDQKENNWVPKIDPNSLLLMIQDFLRTNWKTSNSPWFIKSLLQQKQINYHACQF